MAIRVAAHRLSVLREIRHGRVAVNDDHPAIEALVDLGLIVGDGVTFQLTDKGLDALMTHHVLGEDESVPRWKLVFQNYLRDFEDEGLLKLFADVKHDMLWYFNNAPGTPGMDEVPRLNSGSFEACPLSYRDGSRGSFSPYPGHSEHTENSFVTHWDEQMAGGGYHTHQTKADFLAKIVPIVREEIKRRGLKE